MVKAKAVVDQVVPMEGVAAAAGETATDPEEAEAEDGVQEEQEVQPEQCLPLEGEGEG